MSDQPQPEPQPDPLLGNVSVQPVPLQYEIQTVQVPGQSFVLVTVAVPIGKFAFFFTAAEGQELARNIKAHADKAMIVTANTIPPGIIPPGIIPPNGQTRG